MYPSLPALSLEDGVFLPSCSVFFGFCEKSGVCGSVIFYLDVLSIPLVYIPHILSKAVKRKKGRRESNISVKDLKEFVT